MFDKHVNILTDFIRVRVKNGCNEIPGHDGEQGVRLDRPVVLVPARGEYFTKVAFQDQMFMKLGGNKSTC